MKVKVTPKMVDNVWGESRAPKPCITTVWESRSKVTKVRVTQQCLTMFKVNQMLQNQVSSLSEKVGQRSWRSRSPKNGWQCSWWSKTMFFHFPWSRSKVMEVKVSPNTKTFWSPWHLCHVTTYNASRDIANMLFNESCDHPQFGHLGTIQSLKRKNWTEIFTQAIILPSFRKSYWTVSEIYIEGKTKWLPVGHLETIQSAKRKKSPEIFTQTIIR